MQKYILLLLLSLFLMACSNDGTNFNNPNIPNVGFSVELNTNLPQYNALTAPANPILVTTAGVGVKGILVMKVTDSDYRAWEANCPNHKPSDCSRMSINGINSKCNCDAVEYNLFTGVGKGEYTLKPYRAERLGSVIRVYN